MDFITPLQFSVVEEGIYRGSYPTLRHFCFLERLNIQTIVSLIPEPPTKDLQAFCQLLGIRIIHFQINRLTPLNNPNLQKKLVQAINVILAQSSPSTANRAPAATPASVPMKNKNIYVHCLDGRRVTGLLILLLRRLQNYSPDFSYSEFWKFQLGTNTAYQEELRMNREFDRFVNDINEEFVLPAGVLPRYLWDGEAYRVFPPGLKVSYSVPVEKKEKQEEEQEKEEGRESVVEKSTPDPATITPIPSTTTTSATTTSTTITTTPTAPAPASSASSLADMYDRLQSEGEASTSTSTSTSRTAAGCSSDGC